MATWRQCADWAKVRPAALRLAETLGRGRRRLCWLDHVAPPAPAPFKPNLAGWSGCDLAATWLGHSTVLLRIGGMTVLTDPVFANRIGLDLGLITGGPKRLAASALRIDELPPIDLLLVSHAHFDHLDRFSLSRLASHIPVITSAHNGDLIRDLGFRSVHELSWGESAQVGELTVTAMPVVHWGARTFTDPHRGACSFLIDGGRKRVLFGGDTAYGEQFKDIGGVDLAILGIGAYDPWIAGHATPEQAWQMADQMRAEMVLPMHHTTFRLSHEPMDEPIQRFCNTPGVNGSRIALTRIGQMWKA